MKGFLLTALGAMACGCVQFDLPPLPLAVHIAADVPAEDQAAWRQAIFEWNTATGIEIMHEGDGTGCGLYVTTAEDLEGTDSVGRTSWKDDCQLRARIKPGRAGNERLRSACHETAHAIYGLQADDHSSDENSVMFPFSRPNTFITDEDVEKAMRRVPASMKVSAP